MGCPRCRPGSPPLHTIGVTMPIGGGPPAQPPNRVLSSAEQQRICDALADLGTRIVWVDSLEQVSFDPDSGHTPSDYGVIMTLGGIDRQKSGEAVVHAMLYVNNMNGIQMKHLLVQNHGAWTITDVVLEGMS